jgi:hypothetical protein
VEANCVLSLGWLSFSITVIQGLARRPYRYSFKLPLRVAARHFAICFDALNSGNVGAYTSLHI